MRYNLLHAIPFLIIILAHSSCTDKNTLRVASTGFGDEIELRQNLVFRFNKDMSHDSIIDKWDSTAYIHFSPPIKGLFKWLNKNELVFSPSVSFKPATSYTASLSKALLPLFKTATIKGDIISFHTSPLEITGSSAWWTRSAGGLLTLNMNLIFNYPVSPAAAAQFISLNANGEKKFEVLSQEDGNELTMVSEGFSNKDAFGTEVKIILKPGLKCIDCTEELKMQYAYETKVTAPDRLTVEGFTTSFAGGEGVIEIDFNQPVSDDIAQYIKINPDVNTEIEFKESGITLKGEFNAETGYTVTVLKGIKGLTGGLLLQDHSETIAFAQAGPSLRFTSDKGMYLSGASSKLTGIAVNSIKRINVRIYKIYENNLLSFMRHNRYYETWDEEGGSNVSYSDYDLLRYGDVVMEQEYETKDLTRIAGSHFLNLDFSDKSVFDGLYLVSVRSSDDQWMNATKLVSVSDLGIIAREGVDDVVVFVNSIKTASPVANARVKILSTNNQQLFSGTTNTEGMITFSGLSSKYKQFNPGVISVSTRSDYNCMLLDNNKIETSRFETGGLHDNPSGFHAYIYGDREIYRPGDSVYFNTLIRKNDGSLLGNIPFKIKVLLPNGREFTSLRLNSNGQGAAETRLHIPASSVTGTYVIEAFTFNNVLIGNKKINVEEFIPDRINVKLHTDASVYTIPDTVDLTASAFNLFGPPATDRNYDIDFSLSMKQFTPKGYEKYNFLVNGADKTELPGVFRQGKTNAKGEITESFPLSSSLSSTGMLLGKLFLTVFDETGRPVNRMQTIDIATQKVFYGLRLSDSYVSTGQSVKASLCALNKDGNAVPANATLQLIKINYHNALQRGYNDRYQYVSEKEEKIISNRNVTAGKNGFETSFTPVESGEYAVRIYINKDRYVENTFYAFGWGFTSSGSFAVNTDGEIEISSDKEIYNTGDRAKILFKTPFAGKLLITVERNSILKHFYIQTDKRSAEFSLDIKEDYLPTIYITATLFRPVDEGTIPLTVAHGVLPIQVEKKENRLPVLISATANSKSKTKQTIKVKTKPGIPVEVTIAVVDEGIMQLKNSETPDPYKFFYQKRALGVKSYDMYSYLLPDVKLRRSSTGGDGYNLQKRVNPVTNKRIRLVASWSGILKTNNSGEANYTFTIPQFSGDLRVMVAAWHNSSFGSAEHHIKVADPIVISTALPRFLSPGDTVYIPMTLTNTTSKDLLADASVQFSGPLKPVGPVKEGTAISSNNESRLQFKAVSSSGTGNASVTTTILSGSEAYRDVTDITVRPAASLQKTSRSGLLKEGMEHALDLTTGFIPSTTETELLISRSPVAQFTDHLAYLLDYPHGCAEQITSIAFPQLYYTELVKSLKNQPGRRINPAENVDAAIQSLQSMQLYNGAISYWPGTAQESWWSGIYAAHFLSEAKKAGYNVNSSILNKLLGYLEKKAKEKNIELLVYTDASGSLKQRSIPAKDIFYSLYILALNGENQIATMNYYKNRWQELAIDSRYLLACSYLAAGDRKNYEALLPRQFEGEQAVNATGGNFYSFIRDQSLAMNALMDVDPSNPQLADMARRISTTLQNEKWINTQERAFAFLALGKYLKRNTSSTATASIILPDGSRKEFSGSDLVIRSRKDGIYSIKTTGKGSLYYSWVAEGLPADGRVKEEDSYLKVRRTYFDRFGNAVGNSFKVNDLIVIRIALENTVRSTIENIVITDMLPAGFEIENPRVSAVPELSWIKDNAEPDYMDIRDDRINLYTASGYQPKYFYYLVRAVSAGNFTAGPVSADAMYDGQYHSYHGSGRVIINQ